MPHLTSKGLTQAQAAETMGLAPPHVARIERRPWGASLSRILAYAQAVGAEVTVTSDERREKAAA